MSSFASRMARVGVAVVAVLLVGPSAAIATDISWSADASGMWRDVARWDGANIPNSTAENAWLGGAGAYTATVDRSNYYIGSLSLTNANATLSIAPATGVASITATSIANSGTIILTSAGASNNGSGLASSGTLVNDGTIRVLAGTGWDRTLGGASATNNGTLDLLYYVRITGTWNNTGAVTLAATSAGGSGGATLAGNWTNSGTIDIGAGRAVVLNSGYSLTQSDGSINCNAPLTIYGTLNYNGGAITGQPVAVYNGTVNCSDSAGPASFNFISSSGTFNGDIRGGTTVTASTNTFVLSSCTNNGTLSSSVATTTIGGGSGTLTNRGTYSVTAAGSINGNVDNHSAVTLATASFSGRITLNGAWTNSGSIAVSMGQLSLPAGSSFTQESGTFTNSDTSWVAATDATFTLNGGTLTTGMYVNSLSLNGGAFNYNGGTLNGKAQLTNAALNWGPSANPGEFFISGGTMSGDIPAGSLVHLSGYVGAGGTFTNRGTIIGEGSSSTPTISMPAAARLTNEGTLTCTSTSLLRLGAVTNHGTVNGEEISASDFVNDGAVDVDELFATSYTQTGGRTHVSGTLQSGSVRIQGGTLAGSGWFQLSGEISGAGTLSPDSGVDAIGTITWNGDVTFANGGVYEADLGDLACDSLEVGNHLDLSGPDDTLVLRGGVDGGRYVIAHATYGLVGQFDHVTSGYTVEYDTSTPYDYQVIVHVSVPEPGALMLLPAGLAFLCRRQRTRPLTYDCTTSLPPGQRSSTSMS